MRKLRRSPLPETAVVCPTKVDQRESQKLETATRHVTAMAQMSPLWRALIDLLLISSLPLRSLLAYRQMARNIQSNEPRSASFTLAGLSNRWCPGGAFY